MRASAARMSCAGVVRASRADAAVRRRAVLVGGATVAVRARAVDARTTRTARVDEALARKGGVVTIDVRLPEGYHLTRGANSRFEVEPGGGTGALTGADAARGTARVRDLGDARAVVVTCTVYFCREEDVCLVQRVRFEVPVEEGGKETVRATFAVEPEGEGGGAPEWNRFAVEL